jgi:hypothetical protein
VSLLTVTLIIVGIVVVLPLIASFLIAIILESANHEGIYDDLDQDS